MSEKALGIELPNWKQTGVEVIAVKDWGSFRDTLSVNLGEFVVDRYVFRGVSNSDYRLMSSFERAFGDMNPASRSRTMERLTTLFENILDRNEIELEGDRIHHTAAGQHYGLATRMLDWSTSRYVAAFFAFSTLRSQYRDSLAAESDESGSCVSVFSLDTSSSLWSNDTVEVVPTLFRGGGERLRRQRGCFTVNHTTHHCIEDYVAWYASENPTEIVSSPIIRFDLPVKEARTALRDLHDMRISHSELFPGIEGVAQETMLREWLNEG